MLSKVCLLGVEGGKVLLLAGGPRLCVAVGVAVSLDAAPDLGHVGAGEHDGDELHDAEQHADTRVHDQHRHHVVPDLDLQDLEAAVPPDAEVGPHAVAGELPDLARAAARVLDVAAGVGHVVTQDVAPVLEPGVEVVGAAAPDIEFLNFNIDIQYEMKFI